MIEAKFKDGRRVKYTRGVLDSMMTDADVVEVIDLETGEVLIDRAVSEVEQDMAVMMSVMSLTPIIGKLSRTGFMSLLGSMIDQYGADNGMCSKEICEMLEQLALVQKEVHRIEGMMNPNV